MPLLDSSSSPSSTQSLPRRILFLDAYDSFTNNIVSLLKDALGGDASPPLQVHVLHMDLRTLHSDPSPPWKREQFLERLASFDAVVCGPGPGSPLCADDVGAFRYLWELAADQAVPVLGICLGFQSMVAHFGGRVRKLRRGLHGMVRDIEHSGTDVFAGVEPFRATLYHSLCIDIGQDDVPVEQWEADKTKWQPAKMARNVVPLAWVTEEENGGERVLMAARHASLPFWGVQCHPESVCTDAAVQGVVRNWFDKALEWNETQGRTRRPFELPIVH